MSIQVVDVPCPGTVPEVIPIVLTPYIVAGPGAGFLEDPDLSELAAAQFLADAAGTALDMDVPPAGDPNSTTWLVVPTLAHVVNPET